MTEPIILQADDPADIDAVRGLMRRYVAWHYQRHAAYRAMLDRYFDPAAYEAELAALPASSPGPPAASSSPASAESRPAASPSATSAAAPAR